MVTIAKPNQEDGIEMGQEIRAEAAEKTLLIAPCWNYRPDRF